MIKKHSNRQLISFLLKKLFKVISLEGWTDVLYFVQDAHSFWNWLYFVLLIVVRSDKNQLIISEQVYGLYIKEMYGYEHDET